MAKSHTLFGNSLVDMDLLYGSLEDGDDLNDESFQASQYPQQVFNKLHDEILMFSEGVKSIMEEIEPIKNLIIEKISDFIKGVFPGGGVEVYGSHATKLCLHWSDVDLALVPPPPPNYNGDDYHYYGPGGYS